MCRRFSSCSYASRRSATSVLHVFAGQTATSVTQVEEEDIVNLIDHLGGSELAVRPP